MRLAILGFHHLVREGIIRAVILLNDVNSDVDRGFGGRVGGRHGEAHRHVKEVFAIQRQAPHQSHVFFRRFAKIIKIGRKRHRKKRETKQNRCNSEVEEHVPTRFLQTLLSLFQREVFHQLVLVLVHGERPRRIKFLFGHEIPMACEHFKGATCFPPSEGNRCNQEHG